MRIFGACGGGANAPRAPPLVTGLAKTNDIGQRDSGGPRKVAKVTKIGTQGRYNVGQWVTKFIVSYSIDGGYFQFQMRKSYNVPRVSCKLVGFLNLHYLFQKRRTPLIRQIINNYCATERFSIT